MIDAARSAASDTTEGRDVVVKLVYEQEFIIRALGKSDKEILKDAARHNPPAKCKIRLVSREHDILDPL